MIITNKSELNAAIIELENRKLEQEALLVEQFKATRDSLNPLKMLKQGFEKLVETPGIIGEDILKTAAGVGMAFLSKKLFLGRSPSLIKKALGALAEFTVAKTAINNADKIKAYGMSIYNNLFRKKPEKEDSTPEHN